MKEDTASWVSSFQGLRGRVLKWENARLETIALVWRQLEWRCFLR